MPTPTPILPRPETLATNGWTGFVLLMLLLVYVTAYMLGRDRYIKQLAALRRGRDRYVSYDVQQSGPAGDIVLGVAAFAGIAIGLLSVAARLLPGVEVAPINLGIAAAATLAFYLIKFVALRWIKMVFRVRNGAIIPELMYKVVIFGFVMLIIAIATLYVRQQWVVAAMAGAAVLFAVLYELVELVRNFFDGIGSLFYIILYLCAVEILPLCVASAFVLRTLN